MSTTPTPPDDDLPEIDFSGGTRGKFYKPGATLNLPVYLDAELQNRLAGLAIELPRSLSRRFRKCRRDSYRCTR